MTQTVMCHCLTLGVSWVLSWCFEIRHGYEARVYKAEDKPKLSLNHEAEAEALTFEKHEAEAQRGATRVCFQAPYNHKLNIFMIPS